MDKWLAPLDAAGGKSPFFVSVNPARMVMAVLTSGMKPAYGHSRSRIHSRNSHSHDSHSHNRQMIQHDIHKP